MYAAVGNGNGTLLFCVSMGVGGMGDGIIGMGPSDFG